VLLVAPQGLMSCLLSRQGSVDVAGEARGGVQGRVCLPCCLQCNLTLFITACPHTSTFVVNALLPSSIWFLGVGSCGLDQSGLAGRAAVCCTFGGGCASSV